MTVKELKTKLRGKYTDYEILHTNHRDAAPFTFLGKEYYQLNGKALINWLNSRVVDEYKLKEIGEVVQFNSQLNFVKKYNGILLTIYIK